MILQNHVGWTAIVGPMVWYAWNHVQVWYPQEYECLHRAACSSRRSCPLQDGCGSCHAAYSLSHRGHFQLQPVPREPGRGAEQATWPVLL